MRADVLSIRTAPALEFRQREPTEEEDSMKATVVFGAALLRIACFTMIGGCAEEPPSGSGRLMTGEEIKTLITHRSIEGTNSLGGHYLVYYPDSETLVLRYTEPNGPTTDVKGRLTYKAHAYCVAWNRKDWGNQCYRFERDGEEIVYRNMKDKKEFGPIKMLDGNPFGL